MDHPNERPGLFIAFEGGEGTGKTTQAKILRDALLLSYPDREIVLTHEPGATGAGHVIRQLLLSRNAGPISPRAELMMYLADRANHVEQVIWPALKRGAIVVCDRFADSTIAYQGIARGLGEEEVERMSEWAAKRTQPHMVLVLDIDPVEGLSRTAGRSGTVDRLEAEGLDFHRRVRNGFLSRVERMRHLRQSDRAWGTSTPWYHLIGADRPVSELAHLIWNLVEALIGHHDDVAELAETMARIDAGEVV